MAHELDRRHVLTVLALGTVAALAGCNGSQDPPSEAGRSGPFPQPAPAPGVPVSAARPAPTQGNPPTTGPSSDPSADPTHGPTQDPTQDPGLEATQDPALAGIPRVVDRLPWSAPAKAVALTIDDGFNPKTVAAYVEFALTSGVHLTFNPNGLYAPIWEQHAQVLRPLVERGQVQIGNHTFHHKNIKLLSEAKLTEELERNDEWIQQTFGFTSRPYFRPPFGFHSPRTDDLVAGLGYTTIVMWNGSFGDAAVLTQKVLMGEARKWLRPGAIMLGHANHPTITHLYPELLALIASRELTPVTLDEAFGTSRAPRQLGLRRSPAAVQHNGA